MSLYWPDQKVALEIVDDPASKPFDAAAHPDVTVIPVTCAQIADPEAFDEIGSTLARLLGTDPPLPDASSVARRRTLHRTLFCTPSR